MSTWAQQPICAFDLETTGPDPTSARIVTACVARILPGADEPAEVRTWLLDPAVEIPEGATAVHGISTERAQAEGQDYLTGYTEIRRALEHAWERGAVLVAFNANFDLTVMEFEGRRLGFDGIEPALVVDPFVIDREQDRYRKGKRTLTDVCRQYGVALENSHEAQADAVAAARLVGRLLEAYPHIAGLDIVAEQTRWHAERQRSFRAYLQRNGKDASDVNERWPVRAVSRP